MKDDLQRPEPLAATDQTASEGLESEAAPRSRPKLRYAEGLKRLLEFAASIGTMLVIWHLAVVIFDIPSYILPFPGEVLVELVDQWNDQIFEETMVTFQESVSGFLLAIAVAVPIAILITYSDLLNRIVMPALIVSQVIPKIALAPLFVVWLGFGALPKVLISFLVAFFGIVVRTAVGLRSI